MEALLPSHSIINSTNDIENFIVPRRSQSAQKLRPRMSRTSKVTSFSPAPRNKKRSALSGIQVNSPLKRLDGSLKDSTYSLLKQSHAKCKEQLNDMIAVGNNELSMQRIEEDEAEEQDYEAEKLQEPVEPKEIEEIEEIDFEMESNQNLFEDAETRNLINDLTLDDDDVASESMDDVESVEICEGCEELAMNLKEMEADLINSQEDSKEYQGKYEQIQEEGARLYESYEIKSKQLQEAQEKMQDLEATAKELLSENQMVKEEYNKVYEAYQELAEEYKEAQASLEEKQRDCISLSNNMLELQTENTRLEGLLESNNSEDVSAYQEQIKALEDCVNEREQAYEEACGYIEKLQQEMEVLHDPSKDQELEELTAKFNQLSTEREQLESDLQLAKVQPKDVGTNELHAEIKSLKARLKKTMESMSSEEAVKGGSPNKFTRTLRANNKALRQDNAMLSKEFEASKAKLSTVNSQLVKLKKSILNKEQDVAKLNNSMKEGAAMLQRALKSEQEASKQLEEFEKMSVSKAKLTEATMRIRALEGKVQQQQQYHKELEQHLELTNESHSKTVEDMTTKLKQLEESHQLHDETVATMSKLQIHQLTELNDALKTELQDTKEELAKEMAERLEVDEKRKSLQQDIISSQNELQWLKDQLLAMRKEKDELSDFIEEERTITEDVTKGLEVKNSELEQMLQSAKQEHTALLDSYEGQAKHAVELVEKITALEQQVINCEQKLANTDQLLSQALEGKGVAQSRVNELEEEMQRFQNVNRENAEAFSNLQLEYEDVSAQLSEKEGTLMEAQNKIEQMSDNEKKLARATKEQIRSHTAKSTKLHGDLEAALMKISQIGDEKLELRRDVRLLTDHSTQQSRQIEGLQLDIETLENTVDAMRSEDSDKQNQLTNLMEQLETVQGLHSESERKYGTSQATLARASRELVKVRESCNTYRLVAARAEGRVDGLQEQIQELRDEASRGTRLTHSVNSEHDATKEKLKTTETELAKAEKAIEDFVAEKDKLMKLLCKIGGKEGKEAASPEMRVQKLLKQKTKLMEELTQTKKREAQVNESQKQMRSYLILYKQKADERNGLTEQAMAEQASRIQVLEDKLRHTSMVLLRYKDVLDTEPELAGVLQSLGDGESAAEN